MEKFISCVYSKRCLWDLRVADFHNKSLVRKMWEIVENECNLEAGTAYKKWKNLKDTFRREQRKVSSKWALYKDLRFLKAVMAPRTENNDPGTTPYKIIYEGNNIDSRESNSEPPKKRHAESEAVKFDNRKKAKTSKRKSKSIDDNNDKSNDDDDNDKDDNDDDDDYHFLMSFRTYLKQMSDQKKLKFRIKMQELLYDFMYENELPQTTNSSTFFPDYTQNSGDENIEIMHDMQSIVEYEDVKPVIND